MNQRIIDRVCAKPCSNNLYKTNTGIYLTDRRTLEFWQDYHQYLQDPLDEPIDGEFVEMSDDDAAIEDWNAAMDRAMDRAAIERLLEVTTLQSDCTLREREWNMKLERQTKKEAKSFASLVHLFRACSGLKKVGFGPWIFALGNDEYPTR